MFRLRCSTSSADLVTRRRPGSAKGPSFARIASAIATPGQTGSTVCYPFAKSGTHVDKVPIHVAGEAAESVVVRINIFTGGPAG